MSRIPLDTLLAEGTLAGQAGDFAHAIACFEAALKQAPQHAGVMLSLAKAHGLSFHYPEAERWLNQALRLAPGNPRALTLAAQNYQEWDRPAAALPLLERAAAAQPGQAEGWVEFARALERANRLDEAAAAIERAPKLDQDHPGVLRLQARLAERRRDLPAARALLERALERRLADAERVQVWYALAGVHDLSGEFKAAWDCATQAKALAAKSAEALQEPRDQWRQEISRLAAIPRARVEGHSQTAAARFAILCGYPRSGTTLLGQVMAAHPQAAYADEVLALPRVLRLGEDLTEPARPDWFLHTKAPQREALRREYCRCLEAHLNQRVDWSRPRLMDKNPAVTRALPAMLTLFPNLQVIFPLRDPRDVAVSCYLRPFPLNAFTAHFNRLDRLVAHLQANQAIWQALRAHLEFPWLEVRYEHLIAERGPTVQRVCDFLGLAVGSLPPDHRASAAGRFIHSPTYAEVLEPLHHRAIGRWRAYAEQLAPCQAEFAALIRAMDYD
jgi:tetratricopeptide (TPR) repeat protein